MKVMHIVSVAVIALVAVYAYNHYIAGKLGTPTV